MPDHWTRIWRNRPLRFAWAASIAGLLLAHALSGGLERHAEMYLPVEPGMEEVLLLGAAKEILSRDPARMDSRRAVPGFSEWRGSIADYTPEVVASHTGVPPDRLLRLVDTLVAARRIASSS